MSALLKLLHVYREQSQTEREKGTYFEELIRTYFRNEATYADLYSDVWLYADWAREEGLDAKDVGIDLVAKTRGTNEYHAIQCKCYAEDYRLKKSDIDSFFTASGQKPFTHRIIVSTTNNWSEHAEAALFNQQPPVTKIDLNSLENSQIDWGRYQPYQEVPLKEKKSLRPHQQDALSSIKSGLHDSERGKLIMACGTGKTFTSLKIAEELAGAGKRVLFLVPSLSLLSQTLTEWTQESYIPLHSFAVCSDSEIGKKRKADADIVQTFVHELRYPATTNASRLAVEMKKRFDEQHMSVVFSTYHSLNVIAEAQQKFSLPDFDLIICDEAHRTTGATFADEDESNFVKVHDSNFIRGFKRLYMTATPRIYGDSAKASAEKGDVVIASMDDEQLYGKELFVLNFSEAVSRGLLVDYKVIVLTMDEKHISKRLQDLLKDENNSLKVDDAAKIVGCWKALSKHHMQEGMDIDPEPMRRAVAFCQVIEPNQYSKQHKVSSKQIAQMFQAVVEAYQNHEDEHGTLICEAKHVDGSMNASEKETKLNWLKAQPPENTCHILSNVRCLSEGVDVPALDAVLFLTPRNSQVDVVQSVGRVMRNAPGKKRGYVILPVVIPAGVEPHEALNDNKIYKVVWEVLQALRSHDDRFDAMINKLDLIGKDPRKMEVIAVNDKLLKKYNRIEKNKKAKDLARAQAGFTIGSPQQSIPVQQEINLNFEVGEVERALYAKLVEKCGNRHHWEEWANDIAKIANTHISRIHAIVTNKDNKIEQTAFKEFLIELKSDLNPAITEDEVVEMLAQHLITQPIFEALFEGYSFGQHNPVSRSMDKILALLQEHRLNKEADTLQSFYANVQLRIEGINNAEGKQKIIVELYDKFFRNAFPQMTERLGIVYTPVEVVDFILHSVNYLLQQEFEQSFSSEGVHILDPFTGTGTFITRLMQSGLIPPEQLKNKYQNEIHANEIVLLAYYIAAINIEAVYHGIMGDEYQSFNGICLTDTFQMYEQEDNNHHKVAINSDRRIRQKNLKDIRVIISNPPYSIGQKSENDNNVNITYPFLDERIRVTYAARSKAKLAKGLYDSYIRAVRWASDRIGDNGVIGFVTNAGFIEANTADGLRKCLVEEFSSLYIFHLRGNQRTSGELSRKEGGKIFGSGSRAPIAISLLVKNSTGNQRGQIFFHDIGDYLTREQKLEKIVEFESIKKISELNGWKILSPDKHGDWLNQRDDGFGKFILLGNKKDTENKLFENFSLGITTNRDSWCYNANKKSLSMNVARMISFYNSELTRLNDLHPKATVSDRKKIVEGKFINQDPTKISWTHNVKMELGKGKNIDFEPNCLIQSLYRPFTKQWLYYNRRLNERVYQMPNIFPNSNAENIVICVSGVGAKNFSVLITDKLPCLDNIEKGQCFPRYIYGENNHRHDAITDEGLAYFKNNYSVDISKDSLFYYLYGLLHCIDYRQRYADNLNKEMPRIPCVKNFADFKTLSEAGRQLAELHLNYETVPMYKAEIESLATEPSHYRVEKMAYGKKKDLSTLVYNSRITLKNIPLEAYQYIVNGKPALDWVVERQCIKTDKASGIINDANSWAIETMDNPRYPLELFLRVITVSLETIQIIKNLPKLDIDRN